MWTTRFLAAAVLLLSASSAAPAADSEKRPPPPGDEVMHPTQRGLRLSPDMARFMARAWMQDNMWRDLDLSQEQEAKISEVTSRRLMRMAHETGADMQPNVEFFIETMIANNGKVPAQASREFGERMRPLIGAGREFVDGIADDSRPILSDDQFRELEVQITRQRKAMDRLEQRMKLWADGQYREGENPFDELENDLDGVDDKRPGQSMEMRRARRQAEWSYRSMSVWQWGAFLAGTAALFRFDEAQRKKGEEILAGYQKKAEAVMTRDWKNRMGRNRTQYNLQWTLGDAPKGPWVYRLDREFDEGLKPLRELETAFRREILGLVKPEQKAAVLAEARGLAEKHGLPFEESDAVILKLGE